MLNPGQGFTRQPLREPVRPRVRVRASVRASADPRARVALHVRASRLVSVPPGQARFCRLSVPWGRTRRRVRRGAFPTPGGCANHRAAQRRSRPIRGGASPASGDRASISPGDPHRWRAAPGRRPARPPRGAPRESARRASNARAASRPTRADTH